MNDPALHPVPSSTLGGNSPGNEKEQNWTPWIIAVILIAIVIGLACFLGGGHRKTQTASEIDPYAAQLALTNLHVSQASNFAGDQLTYVEGTIANHGDRTVTAITARVQFPNDGGDQPQVELVPVNLIRTTQPYVDTEPISAAPLKSGSSQDFRLIFDDVSPNWDQQIPQIRLQNIHLR